MDLWLAAHEDFIKVFLVGVSIKANIMHHMGIHVSGRIWDGPCLFHNINKVSRKILVCLQALSPMSIGAIRIPIITQMNH